MKIQLLGTAAAEGYPGIFCKCQACDKARKLGGKDIRTRTSAMIDGKLKIDFPPDTYHHVLANNLDLGKIEHLLFTHTHHDHFYPDELRMRLPGFAHDVVYPLHIYGHDAVMMKCTDVIQPLHDYFELHHIQPYTPFNIAEFQITPLLADHNPLETCFIFYIQKDNKTILYGHDTGWFPNQTWEWLENKQLDLVILDCTHGLLPGRRNHLNIEAVKEIKEIFTEKGMIHEKSKVIATHFSHNTELTHDDLVKIFTPFNIQVAYDGMVVDC